MNFDRGLSNWTAGTATIAGGSRTVTFASANLIAADPPNSAVNVYAAGEGDMFIVDNVGAVPIKSVDSASQVTLDYPGRMQARPGSPTKSGDITRSRPARSRNTFRRRRRSARIPIRLCLGLLTTACRA